MAGPRCGLWPADSVGAVGTVGWLPQSLTRFSNASTVKHPWPESSPVFGIAPQFRFIMKSSQNSWQQQGSQYEC
jgi:hypothetical protein